MSKKTLFILLGIVAIVIVALIAGKKSGAFGKTGNFKAVETQKIERATIIETVAATGKIQPEIEVKLSSEVSGEIIDLPIKEGQDVKKGDLLVKINPDLVQAQVSQSQAALQNSRAGLSQAEATLNSLLNVTNHFLIKGLFQRQILSVQSLTIRSHRLIARVPFIMYRV